MLIKSCPICNEIKYELVYEIRGFMIVKCNDCKHIYTLIDKELNESELYTSGDYEKYDSRKTIFEKIIDYENQRIIDRIEKMVGKGKILDFGSGKGNFLFLAKKRGYKVAGIETAIERAEFCEKNFQIEIIKSVYDSGKIGEEPFNIITLFHVIEHLPNPLKLLNNLINYNLEKNGLIIIEVPNLSSIQAIIARNNWMHFDVPRHISHFTSKKLLEIIRELNLKVICTEHFSFHLGVLGMCHSLLTILGYKGKIIKDLKNYDVKTIFFLCLIYPFALILEFFSSLFRRGGIIRVYCIKNV